MFLFTVEHNEQGGTAKGLCILVKNAFPGLNGCFLLKSRRKKCKNY